MLARGGLGLMHPHGGGLYADYVLALDFKNGWYRSGSVLVRDPSLLTGYSYSRAGAKSELDISGALLAFAANVPAIVPGIGLWVRASVTNLLLNAGSATPLVTQDVTVTAQPYTLSFIGTGTVTLSGASTAGPLVGTGAGNRVSLTFTPAAGTLTHTVSGSVTYAGLVAGNLPGPIIATAGATATVALDDMRFSQPIPADEDWLIHGTMVSQGVSGASEVLAAYFGATTSIQLRRRTTAALGGAVTSTALDSGVSQAAAGRVAIVARRRAGMTTFGAKNSALATSLGVDTVTPFPSDIATICMGNINSAGSANAPIEFVGFKRGTFSDAGLTSLLTAA